MVHKHRATTKATFAKDVSPMRNMASIKDSLAASPATTDSRSAFGLTARLSVPSATQHQDKWHFNKMVENNRSQFNGMHFC